MELTKEQRNKVYRRALEIYSDRDNYPYTWSCLALKRAFLEIARAYNGARLYRFIVSELPEFLAKKPTNIDIELNGVWFPERDFGYDGCCKLRVELLTKCIEETE